MGACHRRPPRSRLSDSHRYPLARAGSHPRFPTGQACGCSRPQVAAPAMPLDSSSATTGSKPSLVSASGSGLIGSGSPGLLMSRSTRPSRPRSRSGVSFTSTVQYQRRHVISHPPRGVVDGLRGHCGAQMRCGLALSQKFHPRPIVGRHAFPSDFYAPALKPASGWRRSP